MTQLVKVAGAAVVLCLSAATAQAAACGPYFENQRYTIVVPYGAGGGYDSYARAFAPVFTKLTGANAVVSNVTAGGGKAGVDAVADAAPEDNVIGILGTIRLFEADESQSRLDEIVTLAGFAIDIWSWYGRAGDSLENYKDRKIVSAGSSDDNSLLRFILAGKVLGLDVVSVSGYDGSVESDAAVLRGEADIAGRSLAAGEAAAKSGDHAFLLLLSDKPIPGYEDVPYLAGDGSAVDRLTADMNPEERAEQMRIAQLIVDAETHARVVIVGSKTEGERRQCLTEAVEAVTFDPEFASAIAVLKRPLTPLRAEEAANHIARLSLAFDQAKVLLTDN